MNAATDSPDEVLAPGRNHGAIAPYSVVSSQAGKAATEPNPEFTGNPRVPYPLSTNPSEILANIVAILRETRFIAAMDLDELVTLRGDVSVRRFLKVESLTRTPDYLVVEIAKSGDSALANIAMTPEGVLLAVEDARATGLPRSIELGVAADRVTRRLGRKPTRLRYVYAHSTAERGYSIMTPLAAAETGKGEIFFNSGGDAFAEEGSAIAAEAARGRLPSAGQLPPGVLRLQRLPAGW